MEENNQPEWVCGKRINEMKCAREYIQATNLVYSDGAFFTQDGRITDETQIRKEIYDAISPHITTNIVRRVDNIMSVLRLEAHRENFDKDTTVMHFKNGTYDLNNGFVQQKFTERWGGNIAFVATTAVYALVHAGSCNFMLTMAALVAGFVWGLLYRLFPQRFLAIIISHALWDVAVFIWFPI